MKATSTISIDFPKLHWGINAGAERELPESPEAQAIILAVPEITKVKEKKEHLQNNR